MPRKKAGRRGNNEGSIRQRKDGTWEARLTIGYNDEGKAIRKSFYGKEREDVARQLTKELNNLNMGTYFEPSKVTLEEWLEAWLEGRRAHIAENTWSAYETMIRVHIAPNMGTVKLKGLKTRPIQNLLNKKYEGGLSARTVKYLYQTINAALRQAVKEQMIPFNPAEFCELPKAEQKEMRVLSVEEIGKFFEVAKESPHYTAFYLDLASGLRRGELLGLRWQDIDFNKGTISVWQQLVKSKTKPRLVFKETKTPKSKRTIKLDPGTMGLLKFHQKRQEHMKDFLGPDYQDGSLVFCTEDGRPLDPDNFRRHLNVLLERAGVPKAGIHTLRHSYATLALEAGVSIKTVQENLGHASIAMTGDIYSHVTARMKEESASKVGSVLAGCQR